MLVDSPIYVDEACTIGANQLGHLLIANDGRLSSYWCMRTFSGTQFNLVEEHGEGVSFVSQLNTTDWTSSLQSCPVDT